MGEAPCGRLNGNMDPHIGLLRQRHPHKEGHGISLVEEALRNALFDDFMVITELLIHFLIRELYENTHMFVHLICFEF